MTQLSREAEDWRVGTAAARSSSAVKTPHPGDGPSGNAGKPEIGPEQSDLAFSPGADMWDEGFAAARSGNHERAIACFVREAEARSKQGSHGRAAIAFRTAAEQARLQGLAEQRNLFLGSAATAYTKAAERNGLTPDAIHEAWISAAKCYLQVQQLDRALRCIERARKVADPTGRHGATVKSAT